MKFYTEQNKERPTRLGVFKNDSAVVTDYWLEDGLPLVGIDIDTHGDMPAIQIMLREFQHTVKGVTHLRVHFTFDGDEDGLDITNSEGNTTILRFEGK
ncbi:MAG: DUF5335 family protein [Pyrinomonadaceae bacterium]